MGVASSAEFGPDFLSMSLGIEASVTNSYSHTYAFTVSETNQTSCTFVMPEDGHFRQAGYSVLKSHYELDGGPKITRIGHRMRDIGHGRTTHLLTQTARHLKLTDKRSLTLH